MTMRIILDCDPGNGVPGSDIDDGLALGLILKSPEFQLEAVTVVGGNTALDVGVPSGLAVLEAAGADVPLYRGSPRPLVEDHTTWRAELDGRRTVEPAVSMWRDVPYPNPRRKPAEGTAAEVIVRIVNAHSGEVTICAVGPLTNVAHAILLDPELPQKVRQITVMGGSFGVWHRPQELNFCYDPEAARIVVTSGAPVTIVPLDATLQTALLLEDNARLVASADSLAHFLGITTDPWIRYAAAARNRIGCALHDPLAVAVLLERSFVQVETARVDIELAGRLTRGRPVSWRDNDPVASRGLRLPDVPAVEIVTGVDNAAFKAFMLERLLRR
jgi:inosine-uridine nucleoside N-ribohydrolase